MGCSPLEVSYGLFHLTASCPVTSLGSWSQRVIICLRCKMSISRVRSQDPCKKSPSVGTCYPPAWRDQPETGGDKPYSVAAASPGPRQTSPAEGPHVLSGCWVSPGRAPRAQHTSSPACCLILAARADGSGKIRRQSRSEEKAFEIKPRALLRGFGAFWRLQSG